MYRWHRRPHTTAERRANQDGWCRGKRKPHMLPNTYDDLNATCTNSWKDHRKTQYHIGGRGEHHQVRVETEKTWWRNSKISKLEDYCKKHNIPNRTNEYRKFNWKPCGRWMSTGKKIEKKIGHYIYIDWEYKFIPNGQFYRSYYVDYYVFHWWSNKDIGIKYIL